MNLFIYYFASISFLALILTMYDKQAAIQHNWRVPERTLFFVSALGGASMMLVAMLAIRHKTRHSKFMIGLPVIVVLHLAAGLAMMYWVYFSALISEHNFR